MKREPDNGNFIYYVNSAFNGEGYTNNSNDLMGREINMPVNKTLFFA